MKKTINILIILILLSMAQLWAGDGSWTSGENGTSYNLDQGKLIRFTCSVDSIDTLISQSFSITKQDGDSWATYPVPAGKYFSSATGKPHLTIYIYGSPDNSNFTVVDTVCTNDSLETVRRTTLNLNYRFPYYRLYVYGVTKNAPDTIMRFRMYLYRRND